MKKTIIASSLGLGVVRWLAHASEATNVEAELAQKLNQMTNH